MANDPIPLNVARRRARRPPEGPESAEDGSDDCPIIALGHAAGVGVFLDVHGQIRTIAARQLGTASELSMLFTGNVAWLEKRFPRVTKKITRVAGETIVEMEQTGFNAALARDYLMRLCGEAGLYGDHVVVRRSGIWADKGTGAPIVHCGNVIISADGTETRTGRKIGPEVWAAEPPVPRPGLPCEVDVARDLQSSLQRLWSFRQPGGAILLLGLLGTGFLGLAARWRPNAFLIGEPGSGKSLLIDVLVAAAPLHHYTNNTTEAGVLGALNGHVKPIFIDESSDRQNAGGAEALMDLVLASASGDGTRGARGKADGGYRTIEMAGVVLYGSVSPPPLQPQHLARITPIELLRPGAGEDNRVDMEALIEVARGFGAALWGRALAGWRRWRAAFEAFRARLAEVGCAAREMDQMGALLSGWWILVEDGVPDSRRAAEGVAAIADSIRKADDVDGESGPRRALQHLLSARVQYDGTTRQDQIAALLARAFSNVDADSDTATRALATHGLRVVLPCLRAWSWRELWASGPGQKKPPEGWCRDSAVSPVLIECECVHCLDRGRRPVPRVSDGGGVWLKPESIAPLFRGHRGLEGGRWEVEILRIPGALKPRKTIRVNGVPGKAIWISREDIDTEREFDP